MTDEQASRARVVLVPAERVPRWLENFERSHGSAGLAVEDGALTGSAEDGSTFTARLPFDRSFDGPADPAAFAAACAPPGEWGVLLVRKGGYAVARLRSTGVVDSKTGQRHVQGRSKAGGWSQQRFARRRDQQARVAYEAAAGHAARVLAGVPLLVVGGDATALEVVVEEAGLAKATQVAVHGAVPDPRRSVLEQAVVDACSARMSVTNA